MRLHDKVVDAKTIEELRRVEKEIEAHNTPSLAPGERTKIIDETGVDPLPPGRVEE